MIRAGLKRLRDERSGNFSIMGALALVPLLMGVGFALDYATMTRIRSELQNATDAAVLAVGREGQLLKQGDAERIAGQILTATLGKPYDHLQVRRVGTQVTVSARVSSGRMFGTFFDFTDAGITTASTADLATLTYEIGLVLDTTGSMKGGKLAAMQDAVNGLIDTMSAQVTEKDRLRFAMVPFSTFVKVDPDKFGPKFKDGKQDPATGAKWLDLAGVTEMPQADLTAGASRFQLYENMGKKWLGCVETRYAPDKDYDISDEPAFADVAGSLFVPTFAIDEPDTKKGNGTDLYTNNYLDSRGIDPYDKSVGGKKERWKKYGVNTDANGKPKNNGLLDGLLGLLGLTPSGKIKVKDTVNTDAGWNNQKRGPGFGCDIKPIVPLTNDYAKLKSQVDSLVAVGSTNITEGVSWGLRVLSPQEPFAEGSPTNRTDVKRIMVVLTDGANSFGANSSLSAFDSWYSSYGYLKDRRLDPSASNDAQTNKVMNARTLKACDAAKTAGVEIYTIRLEEPDVKTGTVLKECASSPANYFDVPNRSQLDEAFKGIKDSMVKLKLAS